jgi:hypothetical protein
VRNISDEMCDLAYAAHHRFLERLGDHPMEIIEGQLSGSNLGLPIEAADSTLLEYP